MNSLPLRERTRTCALLGVNARHVACSMACDTVVEHRTNTLRRCEMVAVDAHVFGGQHQITQQTEDTRSRSNVHKLKRQYNRYLFVSYMKATPPSINLDSILTQQRCSLSINNIISRNRRCLETIGMAVRGLFLLLPLILLFRLA